MSPEDYIPVLQTHPRLTRLGAGGLRSILSLCRAEHFSSEETILAEGSGGDRLHLILKGEVGISRVVSDEVVFFLTTLKPGDFFGEMALLTGNPRSASVQANTDVATMSMDRHGLGKLRQNDADTFATFMEVLAETLADRLYRIDERLTRILHATLSENAK